MKTALVGNTGFVGSNLSAKFEFEGLYNSTNVEESFGTNPELLVYSGVPAQKFLANQDPENDFGVINNAIKNIQRINPKKIVLISTIDVYKSPIDVDENTQIIPEDLEAYGRNRYYLENWVKNNYGNYLVVHLPGLYGKNIKKNFIYDLINVIPSMLKEEKFEELKSKDDFLKDYYVKQDNGFYKCIDLTNEQRKNLKEYFNKIGFSALNFTDSRGIFQFYNLKYLWEHIEKAMENDIRVLNLATEPITIGELYKYIKNEEFKNEVAKVVPHYDFKTRYDKIFNGKNGYIFDKEFVLKDIKEFVNNMEGNN